MKSLSSNLRTVTVAARKGPRRMGTDGRALALSALVFDAIDRRNTRRGTVNLLRSIMSAGDGWKATGEWAAL